MLIFCLLFILKYIKQREFPMKPESYKTLKDYTHQSVEESDFNEEIFLKTQKHPNKS